MKSIKNLFLIFLIVAFSLSLVSCNSNNKDSNIKEIDDIKISLVGSESQSDSNERRYRVEVISDYITDDFYDWEVKWANSNSQWNSKDVNDYIYILRSGYYGDSLDITCLQPFGCQIEVICYLRSNPSVKDSVICDYLSGFTSFDLVFYKNDNIIRRLSGQKYYVIGNGYNSSVYNSVSTIEDCKIEPLIFTVGTVTPKIDNINVTCFNIYITTTFYENLNKAVPNCNGIDYTSKSGENYKLCKIESSVLKSTNIYYDHLIFNFIDSNNLLYIKNHSIIKPYYEDYCSLMKNYSNQKIGFVEVSFTVANKYNYVFTWDLIVSEYAFDI